MSTNKYRNFELRTKSMASSRRIGSSTARTVNKGNVFIRKMDYSKQLPTGRAWTLFSRRRLDTLKKSAKGHVRPSFGIGHAVGHMTSGDMSIRKKRDIIPASEPQSFADAIVRMTIAWGVATVCLVFILLFISAVLATVYWARRGRRSAECFGSRERLARFDERNALRIPGEEQKPFYPFGKLPA
ncbi:hypothetical protein IW261DRAFT_1424238 [Armillaria novae-zelandiae]|uniref:Uncharacterized protein n=1 Tax=Armillaria novae-zelandiae TaxID=153914 RepID=A0AA39NVK3_9AGAR|nr:hypothetical protein IW261DRAFT_1424238 [Armillaria novae-zelandiae]